MSESRKRPTVFRRLSRFLTAAVLLLGGLLFWANSKRAILPPETEILPALDADPAQTEVSDRNFTHKWRDQSYVLQPVAEYDITGLVVSRNDIGGFSDIYHTSDSVDVLDICLVWGDNARDEIFKNFKFWSEPFCCLYQTENSAAMARFRDDQLSNTHVLAHDESLARRLNGVRIGDQIRLRGRLVNYFPAGASEQMRRTSTIRTDTGNGACEVMYVEQFDLLKAGNPEWNRVFRLTRIFFFIALALKIFGLIMFPYLEYRRS